MCNQVETLWSNEFGFRRSGTIPGGKRGGIPWAQLSTSPGISLPWSAPALNRPLALLFPLDVPYSVPHLYPSSYFWSYSSSIPPILGISLKFRAKKHFQGALFSGLQWVQIVSSSEFPPPLSLVLCEALRIGIAIMVAYEHICSPSELVNSWKAD